MMITHSNSHITIAAITILLCALAAGIATYDSSQQIENDSLSFVRTVSAQSAKQNGISYTEYSIDEYKPAVMNRMLTELKATGADWVALVVTHYQYDQNSTQIYPTVKTATDDDLAYAIDRAHQLGLSVTLKPHVDIESDSSIWRGNIGLTFDSSQWDPWFASYTTFINRYATLANTHAVEQFVVGTELAGTSQRETEWRAVINEVRTRYPNGLLTYSANHSGEETDIEWWDAVDHIGISAYYPIASNAAVSLSDLENGWQAIVPTLAALSSSTGKSIIFTEVGFRSTDGTTTQPWCSDCAGSSDEREQADAYQSLYNVIYNQPWFAGMYWWGWDVDPADSGPCDGDYSPYNKAAENVIRQAHGAAFKNTPTDCNNIPATATPIAVAATATAAAPPANANPGFALVDNFDSTTFGVLDGQNGWTTLGNAISALDPIDGGNQVMRLQGENAIAQRVFPFSIEDSSLATIHYRMLRDGAADGASGATEESFPTTFDAFEPQFGVQLGQVDAFRVRDEDDFKTLNGSFVEDSWFCVWIVVDMATIESEIYVKGGSFTEATQLDAAGQTSFQFRNGDAALLRTFYTRTGVDGGGAIYLDDIYLDSTGKNLASPVSGCQPPVATVTPVLTATPVPTSTPVSTPTPVSTNAIRDLYLPIIEN